MGIFNILWYQAVCEQMIIVNVMLKVQRIMKILLWLQWNIKTWIKYRLDIIHKEELPKQPMLIHKYIYIYILA